MSEESQRVSAINEQIAQWKCEHSEMTQMLSKKKVDLATLKEDHIKLESLIAKSPEELRNEKEKLKETVKKIKQSIDSKNMALVEHQNKNQTSSLCRGTFESFYKLLEDIEGLVEKMNALQSEIRDLTNLIERQRKDLRNMSTDETQCKRAMGMKMDKKTKLQIRRQKKQEVKDQQVQIVFSECNQVQEKREDILKQMKQLDCETQQIRAKIQLLTETCTYETEKAQAMHDVLVAVVNQYHERLARLAENGTEIE
ncbi:kinetochore protein Nuf2-like isoform X2 [Polyodon spathula]|nr:kinetochore protein Nuf2-like isoform X2 [Polyodon spathula]